MRTKKLILPAELFPSQIEKPDSALEKLAGFLGWGIGVIVLVGALLVGLALPALVIGACLVGR